MNQNIRVGDVVADRFEVLTVMSESELGVTCLVKDSQNGESFLIKQLSFECDGDRIAQIRKAVEQLRGITHKSLASLKDFVLDGTTGYIVMEFIDGETLESHLTMRRERGQILGLKVAYSFLAHMSLGVEVIHQAGYAFGSLSPRAIFVTRQGRIRVSNYICAYLADNFLEGTARDSYFNTPFIAPEVREGGMVSPRSDVYSMAMLFAELLSSVSLKDFPGSPEAFIARIPGVSTTVKEALFQAAKPDPEDRFPSLSQFKDALKVAVDAPADNDLSSIVVGVNDLRALMVSADLPAIDPATAAPKPDLFDASSSAPRPRVMRSVWIFVKDGIDYGPFDHDEIMKRFYDDEIDESTGILNTQTKKRQNLGSVEEFQKEIQEFIPTRNQNRLIRSQEQLKKQKRKAAVGVSTLVTIILGVLAAVLIPIVILALMPDPKPLNMTEAFPAFERQFEAPKIEEFSLHVDESRAKALFDPNASQAEIDAAMAAWEAEHRKKYASRRSAPGKKVPGSPEDEMDVIVFGTDAEGKELEPLADWEIEELLMSPSMYRRQSACFQKFAGGRKMEVKIKFVIQQNGTTRSFSTTTSGELNDCLISTVSSLKFRPFGGTVKRVTLPVGY